MQQKQEYAVKSSQLPAAMSNNENALFWVISFINIVNIKAFNA